jgi:uncharacterized membrane protein YcgQ (UPF0703/DUF1980 family)
LKNALAASRNNLATRKQGLSNLSAYRITQFSILMLLILSNSLILSVIKVKSLAIDVHPINKSKSLIILPTF